MGYSIHQLETDFFIPNDFKSEALSSIKNLVKNFTENGKKIAFVEVTEIEKIAALEQMLTDLRWTPENNESGDIVEVNFAGEKLGDDYLIFNSIARFVRNNSFITFIGNDGETSKVWRWLFSDGNILEQKGKLFFE